MEDARPDRMRVGAVVDMNDAEDVRGLPEGMGVVDRGRVPPEAPATRTKRRRLAGFGKRWAPAVDAFVAAIPPIKCFVDPRRMVPTRDMRGWIDVIHARAQNGVWDELMAALTQSDIADGADIDICRYILGTVIFEEKTVNSERKQTRQAVNNAIKRELSCPVETGKTSRGMTFRDLFRTKCKRHGFVLTPLYTEGSETIEFRNSLEEDEEPHAAATNGTHLPRPYRIQFQQNRIQNPTGGGNAPLPNLVFRDSGSVPTDTSPNRVRAVNGQPTPALHVQPIPSMRQHMDGEPWEQQRSVAFRLPLPKATDSTKRTRKASEGLDAIVTAAAADTDKVLDQLEDFRQSCARTESGGTAWWTSSRVYLFNHLATALIAACQADQLKATLLDFRWVMRHASASKTGIMNLVRYGYDVLLESGKRGLTAAEREGFRLIRNALMLIRPVLQSCLKRARSPTTVAGPAETLAPHMETAHNLDRAHFATQLVGRLLRASRQFSVIATLIASVREYAPRPWLRPLNPCLDGPRSDIAIAVRSGLDASPVAISEDGSVIVTGGEDHSLMSLERNKATSGKSGTCLYSMRVWSVESGECLCTIVGHKSSIVALAITSDKMFVASASVDSKGSGLSFWRIRNDSGDFFDTVTDCVPADGHKCLVRSIVTIPSSALVAESSIEHHSGGKKSTFYIRVWNARSGQLVKNFPAVRKAVYSLDVSSDGQYLVSGDEEGCINVWDIEQQRNLVSMRNIGSAPGKNECSFSRRGDPVHTDNGGHGSEVYGVCFMEGGSKLRVVSASKDNCIRVWTPPDLPSSFPRKATHAEYSLDAVLTSPSMKYVSMIRCPSKPVRFPSTSGVGETEGTTTIFSGSEDGAVRIWRISGSGAVTCAVLGTEQPPKIGIVDGQRPQQCVGPVFIAVSSDGRRLVSSAGHSPLILVWDTERHERNRAMRRGIYKPYFSCLAGSIDANDIYMQGLQTRFTLPTKPEGYFTLVTNYRTERAPDELYTVTMEIPDAVADVSSPLLLGDNDSVRRVTFDQEFAEPQGGIYQELTGGDQTQRGDCAHASGHAAFEFEGGEDGDKAGAARTGLVVQMADTSLVFIEMEVEPDTCGKWSDDESMPGKKEEAELVCR